MGIFNELSKDFNGGFNPAENLGQVLELMNKYSRIRTRTGAFNPIIYNSWHEKQEEKVTPKTVSVSEIEEAINQSTREQVGFVDMNNNGMQARYETIDSNGVQSTNYEPMPNNAVSTNNVSPVEKETDDIMDM